jgi:cell division protein FtsI/penicillin-binding protein 2
MDGLNEHLGRFGLFKQTGVGLPYDMRGRLGFGSDPLAGGSPKAARVAFGQAVMVSPLGLAAAYGAIANGGRLCPPRLIQEYLNSSGQIVRKEKPTEPEQVATPETASLMREYLQAVVTDGTGKTARVPGYSVAGKTGTAQKVAKGSKSYSGGKYVASFFGFIPAKDPQAVIAVVIDEPKGAYYGAQVAAPVFQRIAQRLMWYWKVPPDHMDSAEKSQIAQR